MRILSAKPWPGGFSTRMSRNGLEKLYPPWADGTVQYNQSKIIVAKKSFAGNKVTLLNNKFLLK